MNADMESTEQSKSDPLTSTNDDEENVKKAVRFWKHPSLRDIPTDQKRAYLHEKGVTDAQIHEAWERIVEEDEKSDVTTAGISNSAIPSSQPSLPQQSQTHYSTPTNPFQHESPYIYQHPSHGYHQNGLHPREEEESPLSFVQGSSLVALGGVVGLGAAAAARWLNGGEFKLFPPPTNLSITTEDRRLVLQDSRIGSHENSDEEEDFMGEEEEEDDMGDEEEDDEIDYEEDVAISDVQEKMLQHIESLSDTMKSHVGMQEKILQKLSKNNSGITNSSMDLLRSSSSTKDKRESEKVELMKVWAQLVEIKSEIVGLCRDTSTSNGDRQSWEDHLTATLSRLGSCMDKVEASLEINGDTLTTTKNSAPNSSNLNLALATTNETTDSKADSSLSPATVLPIMAPTEMQITPSSIPALEEMDPSIPQVTYSLRESIRKIAEENDPIELRVGSQLLYLYIVNLSGKPDNPRYRKIFTCNESFQKVDNLIGGKDLLFAVGFEEIMGCLEWLPNGSTEQESLKIDELKEAAAALSILKSANKSADLTESALAAVSSDPNVQMMIPPTDAT